MCGICGYLGDQSAIEYVMDGLQILLNRGYDSVGCSFIDTTTTPSTPRLVTTKYASSSSTQQPDAFQRVSEALASLTTPTDTTTTTTTTPPTPQVGIGHTRWKTHGGQTDQNAHPHLDQSNQIALVHNGMIENYAELKTELIRHNYQFRSETDSEVIVNLIAYYLSRPDHDHDHDFPKALYSATSRLYGTWALAIIHLPTPNRIYLAQNGSPLLIAYDDHRAMVASEQSAFANHFSSYVSMDNDIMILERSNTPHPPGTPQITCFQYNATSSTLHLPVKRESRKTSTERIALTPSPYPYFFIKEVSEQPTTVRNALNNGARIRNQTEVQLGGLNQHQEQLLRIRHLIILACGTSRHAGLLGAEMMRRLRCFDVVQVLDASNFDQYHIPSLSNHLHHQTGILVISQSGETKDLHRAIGIAQEHDIMVFSIVNVVNSQIARDAICGVYLNAGREVSVASTKAFTSQVVVLCLIAIWFAQNRERSENLRASMIMSLRNLSFEIANVINSAQITDQIRSLAATLTSFPPPTPTSSPSLPPARSMFILGRGLAEPIVIEAALKIKEISYIHAEGFSLTALKHGTYALIEAGTPVLFLDLHDEYSPQVNMVAEQTKSRGAFNVLFTCDSTTSHEVYDEIVVFPENKITTSVVAGVVFQLLAYELTVARGLNPDYPRGLAKTVTV